MKSNKELRIFCCVVVAFLSVACPANGDWSKESKLLAYGPAAGDKFGTSVCINANLAIVGAPYDDSCGADSGSAYIYSYDGTDWVQQAKLIDDFGQSGDRFGVSVSIRGSYAIVGANGDDDNGTDSGAAYIYRYDGKDWVQQTKLTASDGQAGDWFGNSVSISAGYVIVGAPADDDNGADSGSAYIYGYDGTDWVQQAKLTASDGGAGDVFGWSVSINGGCAVAGAYRDDDNGAESGAAYIYRYNGTNWVQEAKLTASDGQADDQFGWSVSINSGYTIVGVYHDDDNGNNSGSAYIYSYDGTNWVQQAKLTASDGQAGDFFGMSVSIRSGYAVVGTLLDDDNGAESGAAYIYRYDGANWVQQVKVTASDGQAGDRFGMSVSIDGSYVIAGTYGDDDNGASSGSAYIYSYDGTNWVQQAKLTASDGQAGDFFGMSVSISGEYAIVGAFDDDDNGNHSGSAYIYRYDGTDWGQQAKLTASDGQAGDEFGLSVSISSDYAIVGAPADDDNGYNSGSAYIYRYDGTDWVQQAKLTASDGFGRSVSINGEYAIVGAPYDDDNGNQSGSAYIYRYDGTNWLQQAKLTASDAETDDFFGYSVSINGSYAISGAYYWRPDANGIRTGSAYIYKYEGTNWVEQAKLIGSSAEADDGFGCSVSISGEYAIVSSYLDDDNGTNSGSAYIYRYDGTNWVQQAKLTASDGEGGDVFGRSVSINGEYAIVGADGDEDNGIASGSAYIYRYDGANWVQQAKLVASDGEAYDEFGISVSIGSQYAMVGAQSNDDNGIASGSAYIYGRSCPAVADLDGNCRVDFADFAVFADWWLYGTR